MRGDRSPDPARPANGPAAETPPSRRAVVVAYGLLTLTMATYGLHAVVGRAAAGDIPPIALAFWRWFLVLILLLPFAWRPVRKQWPLIVENIGRLTVAGLFMVGFVTFYYIGLNDTTAINAALINSGVPVIIVAATFLARMEHLSRRQGTGLVLSLLGVAVVICRGDLGVLASFRFHGGDVIVLGALGLFAFYSVMLRTLPKELDYLTLMGSTIAVGTAMLVPAYLWELSRTGPFALTVGNLMIVAFVVLAPGLLGYFCWMKGVRVVGVNRSGFTYNLVPVFSTVAAVIFLGESIEPYHAAGFAFVFIGLYLALIGRREPGVAAPPQA
ncbi:MAG: DMT family transporter [Alphaproteobacteria bacterium]|nr:DMT family transporter [Alphaproteobacteria bacterium]